MQHVFTHFKVEMEIAVAVVTSPKKLSNIVDHGDWKPVRPADLPSLMRKVWEAAQTATASPTNTSFND